MRFELPWTAVGQKQQTLAGREYVCVSLVGPRIHQVAENGPNGLLRIPSDGKIPSNLLPAGAAVAVFLPGGTYTTGTTVITAADAGKIYRIALAANNELFALPPPATLPDGWAVRVQTTGMGTGFQTARATAGTGTPFFISGAAAAFCPLIGHGEILEFVVIGGVYHIVGVAPPSQCKSTRTFVGTAAFLDLPNGAWTEAPTNTWASGANPLNCGVSGNRVVLPCAGLWMPSHVRQFNNRPVNAGTFPVGGTSAIGSSSTAPFSYGAYELTPIVVNGYDIRSTAALTQSIAAGAEIGSYLNASEAVNYNHCDYYSTSTIVAVTFISR